MRYTRWPGLGRKSNANAKKAHTRMYTDETLLGADLRARYERGVGDHAR